MGVAGVGKTTVGRLVAERFGWTFLDADDLHPPENVAKMARGEGLTDADRAPWLAAVREVIEARLAEDAPAVLACSALKRAYRDALGRDDGRVRFVWLDAPDEVVRGRLADRAGHFADEALLPSQRAALEPPDDDEAVRVAASGPPAATARRVVEAIGDA
jgi:gluconokinase